jgi:hypothetical protein
MKYQGFPPLSVFHTTTIASDAPAFGNVVFIVQPHSALQPSTTTPRPSIVQDGWHSAMINVPFMFGADNQIAF